MFLGRFYITQILRYTILSQHKIQIIYLEIKDREVEMPHLFTHPFAATHPKPLNEKS